MSVSIKTVRLPNGRYAINDGRTGARLGEIWRREKVRGFAMELNGVLWNGANGTHNFRAGTTVKFVRTLTKGVQLAARVVADLRMYLEGSAGPITPAAPPATRSKYHKEIRKPDILKVYEDAIEAFRRSGSWLYCLTTLGTGRVISVPVPTPHTMALSCIFVTDYMRVTGLPAHEARKHLRQLVAGGFVTELPRHLSNGVCQFQLMPDDAMTVGKQIIEQLAREGLPIWGGASDVTGN